MFMNFYVRLFMSVYLLFGIIGIDDYISLRWFVFLGSIYLVIHLYRRELEEEVEAVYFYGYIGVAILFNPFFPIFLYNRTLWNLIDLGTIALFLSHTYFIKHKEVKTPYVDKEYEKHSKNIEDKTPTKFDELLKLEKSIPPKIKLLIIEKDNSIDIENELIKEVEAFFSPLPENEKLFVSGVVSPDYECKISRNQYWKLYDNEEDRVIGIAWLDEDYRYDYLLNLAIRSQYNDASPIKMFEYLINSVEEYAKEVKAYRIVSKFTKWQASLNKNVHDQLNSDTITLLYSMGYRRILSRSGKADVYFSLEDTLKEMEAEYSLTLQKVLND